MFWILIIIFSILSIIALYNAIKNQNAGSYYFLCLCLIILVIFLLLGPLEYTIGGQYIEIKGKIDRIETRNKELQEVASTLTKMIYVAIDGSSRFGGTPLQRRKKIGEYKKSIAQFLPPQFEEEIASDLGEINP